MQLLGVNVGGEEPIENAGKSGRTGIYKRPVAAPVQATYNGLAGDEVSDKENHGGRDQAVYVFGTPDYDWWSKELGHELSPGTFGENLTIAGLESATMGIGDRLKINSVVLEVTAPRIPCATLAARMRDPLFVKRFRWAERPGVYCRVLRGGVLQAGDRVELRRYDGSALPVIEVFRDFFDPEPDEAGIRRQLAAPLAVRARVMKEKQLQELLERENRRSKQTVAVERT